jgi:hypothetical protein
MGSAGINLLERELDVLDGQEKQMLDAIESSRNLIKQQMQAYKNIIKRKEEVVDALTILKGALSKLFLRSR